MANFDDKFIKILEGIGQLPPFLDAVFGFLYRNTDFFYLNDQGQNLGFPQGVNRQILLSVFDKWEKLADTQLRSKIVNVERKPIVKSIKNDSDRDEPDVSVVAKEEEVVSSNPKKPNYSHEDETFNGADRGTFRWTQTDADIDLTIPVESSIRKGSQIKVDISRKKITVLCDDGKNLLLEGNFLRPINVEGSTWSLIPGDHLTVFMEKTKSEDWWDRLFEDEEKIDTTKLCLQKKFSDMDVEERMKVEEIIVKKEAQDREGVQAVVTDKPSKMTESQKILMEAWDKEGSPFKGQPFDPSVLN